jgi:hypothetical protein
MLGVLDLIGVWSLAATDGPERAAKMDLGLDLVDTARACHISTKGTGQLKGPPELGEVETLRRTDLKMETRKGFPCGQDGNSKHLHAEERHSKLYKAIFQNG